ncbi:AIG2 family protein [Pyrolobus fumarii 1A]|uniref:AIG2 family protein n=1 Tax=Pyrolobus fumarii (strain DSM 11204 / 1A) TaxID=694429 RepID=G0EFD4_PYRF1|nr:gamma-glutamylcyclotransferase family protein [Pyrolobus fumarii]AEM38177.1 AIG2 family protein [Pyrolobus fumarii 1A]
MLLFAYGTLMYGMPSHGLMAGARFAGRGWVKGQLFLCDGYPLLVLEGDGRVWGELYHVPAYSIARIDHYEGADLPDSPWRRVTTHVYIDGVELRATVYASPSVKFARNACDEITELQTSDYRDVVKLGPPRWLVALPMETYAPPGIILGSEQGVANGASWLGSCFAPDGSEEVTVYDVLVSHNELMEWIRSLGCSFGGLRVKTGDVEVYPVAPVHRQE